MNTQQFQQSASPITSATQHTLTLEPNDATFLATLCGQLDQHLRLIEQRLKVTISNRGNVFELTGAADAVTKAQQLIGSLYQQVIAGLKLTPEVVHLNLQELEISAPDNQENPVKLATPLIVTRKATIKPRGRNQQHYVREIHQNDINFGIGPAGTGKTYLAVACAVEALQNETVSRILLVRPAVEAGEKLGFLPGDLAQKIDPYLRPLYDALYEMMGFEAVNKLIERNILEVAPLAYMRGRSLNNSFIILDEAQNTTREQMKMFLTRIGFGSTAVITGDVTQIDLPRGTSSGLTHAISVLSKVGGISFTHFAASDVIRHPLVRRVVEAYDAYDAQASDTDKSR